MSRFPPAGFGRTGRLARDGAALLRALGDRSMKLEAGRLPKLPEALAGLVPPLGRVVPGKAPGRRPSADAAPGRFEAGRFAGEAGAIDYKLYVPAARVAGRAVPLVLMLHGCTQDPDDFAAGTGMNARAEGVPALVLYPAQSGRANAQRCWNWFRPGDQARGGEAALLAALTRHVAAAEGADPARIFVAGLSAGGAAASILGQAYPDIFAAVGVHSGLACGAARDVSSALAAMRDGAPGRARRGAVVPAIIFHGTEDRTVHPRNAEWVAAQLAAGAPVGAETEEGRAPGGRAYRVTRYRDAAGRVVIESWAVDGGGHAWSGGSAAGSYTDPAGPDASAAMLRFFAGQSRGA